VSAGLLLLAFVTLQRGAEVLWARRNARRLIERGAVEVAPGHYPVMVALHAAWLAGLWWLAWDRPPDPVWAGAYLAVQAGRIWVLVTLRERWTTRIVVLPNAKPVSSGPYRFVDHPNYLVVAAEIALLPLAFGLTAYALVFSLLNALVLAVRVRAENAALGRRSGPKPA
jgi:methyltransferase